MSVGSVLIGLHATRSDGRGVTAAEFLAPLAIRPGEVEAAEADGGAWTAGIVRFSVVRYRDFDHVDCSVDGGAQSLAFVAGIAQAFGNVANFLDQRPTEITTSMRAAGLALQLFVEVRMDDDQMDLEFPPKLLAACSRHGIGMYLISNDIPAHEVWAARQAEIEGD